MPIIPIAGGAREVLSRSAHVLSDVPSAMRQQLAPVLDVRSPSVLIYHASRAKLTRVRVVCRVQKLGVPILDAGFRNVCCLTRLTSSSTADGVLSSRYTNHVAPR